MKRKRIPAAKCMDPKWVYVPAVSTNLKERFDKIWKEQKRLREAKEPVQNVRQLRRKESK